MLRFLWVLCLLTVTALGVWLASSLVAFAGGPAWLAVAGGVLLFPVLPVWWEKRATDAFHARLRRARRLLPKKRALSWPTRVALRTVALNVVFVALLLLSWPKIAFAALATRGDWFLDGESGAAAERARSVVVSAASGLEWLHRAAAENPYRTKEDERAPLPDDVKPVVVSTVYGDAARWRRAPPPPPPTPSPRPPSQPDAPVEPAPSPAPPTPSEPVAGDDEPDVTEPKSTRPPAPVPEEPAFRVGRTTWPWPNTPHVVVQGLTAADETSPEAVARFIAARVSDPFERVKALHDWVVTRLRYDDASVTGPRKPQDARSVFDARLGVCEGYARLLVELGRHSGDRIVYVTGEVREEDGQLAPVGHAWNAVQVAGAWYLLDATWDDPTRPDGKDTYRTDYLFIPPQLAGLDHFPDEPGWQLREDWLSRAEFLRQPLARPGLAREGLALKSPSSVVVDVDDTFTLELSNPGRVWVMARVGEQACGPTDAAEVHLTCKVPRGAGRAVVFANAAEFGSYDGVASFTLR